MVSLSCLLKKLNAYSPRHVCLFFSAASCVEYDSETLRRHQRVIQVSFERILLILYKPVYCHYRPPPITDPRSTEIRVFLFSGPNPCQKWVTLGSKNRGVTKVAGLQKLKNYILQTKSYKSICLCSL